MFSADDSQPTARRVPYGTMQRPLPRGNQAGRLRSTVAAIMLLTLPALASAMKTEQPVRAPTDEPAAAQTPADTAAATPAAHRPLLRILEPAGTQSPAPPPAIDLRRLEVDLQELDRGQGPEPVLVIELEIAGTADRFPDDAHYSIHLDYGRSDTTPAVGKTIPPAALTLTMRTRDRRSSSGRRRMAGAVAGPAPRFDGPPEVGPISSVDPGRKVTFRLPVATLIESAGKADRAAADCGDGTWWLRIRAEAAWSEALDRLPRGETAQAPAATFQIPVGD